MSKYRKSYVSSHCIDLFFNYRGKAIHVLTDGNVFPEELDDLERNRGIQQAIALNPEFGNNLGNIPINPIFEETFRKLFPQLLRIRECLRIFLSMAAMGFYSYDCVEVGENGRGKYVLVASPNRGGKDADIEIPEYDGIDPIMEGEEMVGFWM